MPFEKREFPELDECYLYSKIEGGPQIYLIPKQRSQNYVLLQVPFGSLDVTYRLGNRRFSVPGGSAHFIEHKLFANEDGRDSLEILGALGANGNAYTTLNSTCYLFSCRENLIPALSELLRFVSEPYFTEKNVASERSVIEQEIAMYDDSPSTALYYLALRAMYEKHPIRKSICGTKADVSRLDAATLGSLYRAFYHPSNWRIFVSGRFDAEEIKGVVERFLSSDPPPALTRKPFSGEPTLPHRTSVTRRMRVHRPLFALGLKLDPPIGTPEQMTQAMIARGILLSTVLGKSGSLYESLYDRGLVTAPAASAVEMHGSAAYLLITGESEYPEVVLDEITAALADAASGKLDKDDFERTKRVTYSDFLASLDSTEELAEGFCSAVVDSIDLFTYGRLLSGISCEYALNLFKNDFDPARLVRARILPK